MLPLSLSLSHTHTHTHTHTHKHTNTLFSEEPKVSTKHGMSFSPVTDWCYSDICKHYTTKLIIFVISTVNVWYALGSCKSWKLRVLFLFVFNIIYRCKSCPCPSLRRSPGQWRYSGVARWVACWSLSATWWGTPPSPSPSWAAWEPRCPSSSSPWRDRRHRRCPPQPCLAAATRSLTSTKKKLIESIKK